MLFRSEALTSAEADTVLRQLCALVERLPPAARACWDACLQRDFNLGFAGAAGRTPHESRVGTDTLARVAALGGTVTITVYPPYEPVVAPKEVRSARARNRRRRQRSLAAPRGGR